MKTDEISQKIRFPTSYSGKGKPLPAMMPGTREGGTMDRAGLMSCMLLWYTSASAILLDFALLFWNQILTCVSVSSSSAANSDLSAIER